MCLLLLAQGTTNLKRCFVQVVEILEQKQFSVIPKLDQVRMESNF